MLITFHESATDNQINSVIKKINAPEEKLRLIHNGIIKKYLYLGSNGLNSTEIKSMSGVKSIVPISVPYKLASRQIKSVDSLIKINEEIVGGDNFTVIAGPCSVENENQIFQIADFLKKNNINFLRGGAFKPRTSPYSFQGLGIEGLKLLGEVRKQTGINIVSEAMDIVSIDQVAEYVDIVQIGSRSMQNFPLLKRAGKINKPVLLKRGLSATIEEFLLSAEYILNEGNEQVILCERGIRGFNDHTRNMLDIGAIPVIKEISHLPIIVDPSHAAGKSKLVPALAKAALVTGANGLLIEIHPHPEKALSDGKQSLNFSEFTKLYYEISELRTVTT